MQSDLIKKSKEPKTYANEAKFYFEDNGFDYYKALKAYREDINHEIQLYKIEKEKLKLLKK